MWDWPPRQGEVVGQRTSEEAVDLGASTGRRWNRSDQVRQIRIQPVRREIGGGDGSVRTTFRLGVQPEQADEPVGRAAKADPGRLIRCGLLQTKLFPAENRSPQKQCLRASVSCRELPLE